jgi:trehalose/maltose hydrolase-like predicted phosphorylase
MLDRSVAAMDDDGQRLAHSCRAIIFDWDGTAVVDREEDATPLATLLMSLLAQKVWIVVVTGTNVGHIERQLIRRIPATRRRRILLCTNRGSEVYGFDRRGTIVRRWLRVATADEERKLSAIAEALRDAIGATTHLEIGVVSDRLNRRKIDLIPLPAWANPPKARIDALLATVERRLRAAGFAGGLNQAIHLAAEVAKMQGLPDARITSDVKHIEVGLTDKGDAVRWIVQHLLHPQRIDPSDVLIVGDEFGPIAGFPGSDDRLRAEVAGATVVSVGNEPNGAPAGVVHLGGGPPRFRAVLADQAWRHDRRRPPSGPRSRENRLDIPLSPDPLWRIDEGDHAHLRAVLEHETESRCTVSNGFLGVRGSLDRPLRASRPRTFVAGLFATPHTTDGIRALIPAPDWTRFTLRIDGIAMALHRGETLAHRRTLDYRSGMLLQEWRQRTPSGRVVDIRTVRFVSLADRTLAIQIIAVAIDQPAALSLRAHLGVPGGALRPTMATGAVRAWRTADAGSTLALAPAIAARDGDQAIPCSAGSGPAWHAHWTALPSHSAVFVRAHAFARAGPAAEASGIAAKHAYAAHKRGIQSVIRSHRRAWEVRWAAGEITIDGDDAAQRAIRFALYHLIGAANPADDHVSIGARGLTGDAYLGHVFWDTEIFMLPFYLFTWPAAARALLMYRYHTLPAARAKAAHLGYRGALYAWESTDTGEEATPPSAIGPDGRIVAIRCGTDEHHISADVAYAVWHYWQATRDTTFMREAGAEILLETARFWGSRASVESDGRHHIRGVIGPDEYHEGVDDDAYTNAMARWNLACGCEVARMLATRWPDRWQTLRRQLDLSTEELARWRTVAEGLVLGQDAATGLIAQFAGYFALEDIDLAAYADRTAPIDVVLGPERTQRSQVTKQADVVMCLALLWDQYTAAQREANFRYYEPRCAHGSSLSPAIHALVAARLGDRQRAEHYFHEAAAIDLGEASSAATGIHMGALGGLWQAIVFGFGGISFSAGGIRVAPQLPPHWRALRFPLRWRARVLRIEIEQSPLTVTVAVTLTQGQPLSVHIDGCDAMLQRGQSWRYQFAAATERRQETP